MLNEYAMGLDLAKLSDYTALAVAQRVRIPAEGPFDVFGNVVREEVKYQYHIPLLERFKLGTSYPEMVEHVVGLLGKEPLGKGTPLVVDATGVGEPVVDQFREKKLFPIAVTITGGEKQHNDGMRWSVPKIDLLSVVDVLLQRGELKVLETLELTPVLMQEMLNLHAKIKPNTGHVTLDTWRESQHDDLVFAVALACWWAKKWERQHEGRVVIDRGGFRTR